MQQCFLDINGPCTTMCVWPGVKFVGPSRPKNVAYNAETGNGIWLHAHMHRRNQAKNLACKYNVVVLWIFGLKPRLMVYLVNSFALSMKIAEQWLTII